MAGLQLGGLVSGMDTDTIITQLLALERAPERRWGFDKVAAQTRQSALRDTETRLKSLKTAVDESYTGQYKIGSDRSDAADNSTKRTADG